MSYYGNYGYGSYSRAYPLGYQGWGHSYSGYPSWSVGYLGYPRWAGYSGEDYYSPNDIARRERIGTELQASRVNSDINLRGSLRRLGYDRNVDWILRRW